MNTPVGGVVRRLRQTARSAEQHADGITIPLTEHLGLVELIRLTAWHAKRDQLAAHAGNLAYNSFLAIFPFLLFLVSLLKFVHATSILTSVVDDVAGTLPSSTAQLVRRQIMPEVVSRLTDSPFLSVLLAAGSLWAVSAVARAMIDAMNTMYEVEDERPFWARLVLSITLSTSAAALFLGAVALVVFGPSLPDRVSQAPGFGPLVWLLWSVLEWAVLLSLLLLAFALLYHFAPAREQAFRFVSPGAVVAAAIWLIFSAIFSLVLNQFGRNLIDPLYGWFAGLIILLIYMYWSSFILLVGAEINRVIESEASRKG